jgi:acetyl-CoA C-acetyltransferase
MTAKAKFPQAAIVGMGCTRFGDLWNKSFDDLAIDATLAALNSSQGLSLEAVEAFWLGTMYSGSAGVSLSGPLKLDHKPVTRVENFCATGTDALRNAIFAVTSGAYDCVMAVGAEKLKDASQSGLTPPRGADDGSSPDISPPGMFSLLVPAYAHKWGMDYDALREAMTHVAWKNHHNGALNSRAHFQRELSRAAIKAGGKVTDDLNVFDCSGVSDGAAAAIVVRAEDAHRYTDRPLYVHGLSLVAGPASGRMNPDYDFASLPEVGAAAQNAYAQAGITRPAHEIAFAEVHDCFTITELLLVEELGFSASGSGWSDMVSGRFDLSGELPINPDGGLKSFGHPVGASGLRMIFEAWLQFRGEAEGRQLSNLPRNARAISQNLGGAPGSLVASVAVLSGEPKN